MTYYTERSNLRNPIELTYEISSNAYSYLYDCCEKYFEYIAYQYPGYCEDGEGIIGLDYIKFSSFMEYEIPGLCRNDNQIITRANNFITEYDSYAILDLIEYLVKYMKDIHNYSWHGYFSHNHLSFAETNIIASNFRKEINDSFTKVGLKYIISENDQVERLLDASVINEKSLEMIEQFSEVGIKELIEEAISLYRNPRAFARKNSVEKVWDAFERLKTYYTDLNKKQSSEKVCKDASLNNPDFEDLITLEFLYLTKVGNTYRIRHHETDKKEIHDDRHYDYLFNRCLSLVVLVMKCVEGLEKL